MIKNKIVIVVAHPDDAELLFGGIIHKSVLNNHEVNIVIVTDGSKWSKIPVNNIEELKIIRKKEALKSAKILGVKKVVFLDMEDGNFTKEQLFPRLFETLRQLNPSFILTHNVHEGHPDHTIVSKTVQRICNVDSEPMPLENDFWPTENPPTDRLRGLYVMWEENVSKNAVFVHLNKENIRMKSRAISCYKSQFPQQKFKDLYRKELIIAGYYGVIAGTDYAESLEQLNIIEKKVVEFL